MTKKKPLLEAIFANKEDLLERVQTLVTDGADPNECTEYFETPLRVASRNARFDVVKYLFESGADPSHLNWTPLFHAVAYGSLDDMKKAIQEGNDVHARDTWERTPVLLAVQTGEIEKVTCLVGAGADITDLGRGGKSAPEYAIQRDDSKMLTFLLDQGFDPEGYNDFGYTPLIQAAEVGAISCVRCLLARGADIYQKDRSQFSQKTAIAHARTLDVVEVLAAAGDDLNQMEGEARAKLFGLGRQDELKVSKQEYLAQKYRVYGSSNPEQCDKAFWYDAVRCNAGAWKAREHFGDTDSINDNPVWCYERFGKSITAIGQGEFVEIAGEHEDYYDPDFCIYNEVFHHKGNGDFTIYQYPKDIFPPTDFHTATLVDGFVYIIGNLGYLGERCYGTTPVYRLDISSFRMEKLETFGECPGWINRHSAYLKNGSVIRIQGGSILEHQGGKEQSQINKSDYELNVNSLEWVKCSHVPRSGKFPFFPEEYKHFSHSNKELVAIEDAEKWRLLKVISVERLDVRQGQNIQFEEEKVFVERSDFLFVVAYSTSRPFESFDHLEKAVAGKVWDFDEVCRVCRTTMFPASSRFLGFAELTQQERDSFRSWKTKFEQGQAKIN